MSLSIFSISIVPQNQDMGLCEMNSKMVVVVAGPSLSSEGWGFQRAPNPPKFAQPRLSGAR